MKIIKNTLLIFFCLATFIQIEAQSEIIGPDEVEYDCCETYSVSVRDTQNIPGIWTLCDANGNIIDTLHTKGPRHQFSLCPGDYPNSATGLFTLKFSIDDLQIQLIKTIIVAPTLDLEIFDDYSCTIEDSICTTVCIGAMATYVVESNNPNQLSWSVSGGTIVKDEGYSIQVIWDQVGRGSVTVTTINSNCPRTAKVCVEVLPHPSAKMKTSPPFNANNEINICKGQTIYFDDISKDALTNVWHFGLGISQTGISIDQTFDQPGDYQVLLITDNGCSCVDTTAIVVKVEDAESPTLTCLGTTCPNETSTYYVQTSCNEVVWTVSPNGQILDGGGLTDNFVTVDWLSGPFGEISVQGQNCPMGYCSEPSVYRIPVISTSGPIYGDETVCVGQIETYSAPAFQSTEYFWTISSGGTIKEYQGSSIVVQWDKVIAPDASQWVEVTYDNCYLECGGSAKLNINVLGRFNIEGEKAFCENSTPTFSSISENGGIPVQSNWQLRDGMGTLIEQSTSQNSSFTISSPLNQGDYIIISEADVLHYCDNVLEWEFSVKENPPTPAGILTNPEVCKGALHQFQIDQPNVAFIASWQIMDGADNYTFENQAELNYRFTSNGPYAVSLYYKEAAGLECTSDAITTQLNQYQFTVQGVTDICQEERATYRTASNKNSSFFWSINPADAGVITQGQGEEEIEIYWTKPGQHKVSLEHCGGVQEMIVDVHTKIVPEVNHPVAICANETTQVNLKNAYSTVEWFDEYGTSVQVGADVNLAPGYYYVHVVDQNGCEGKKEFFIGEVAAPEAIISINEIRVFCETEPFAGKTIVANTDGDYHYEWYYNGSPAGIDAPNLKASGYGTYHCIVTNNTGCQKRSNDLVLIEDCSGNGGGGSKCTGQCKKRTCPIGDEATFDILDDPKWCNRKEFFNTTLGTIVTHKWLIEDLTTNTFIENTDILPNHTFKTAGYHMVILDVEIRPLSNPGITCNTNVINVVEIPVAAWFTYKKSCANEPTQFEDLSTFIPGLSIANYEWDFGDPVSGVNNTSNLPSPTHIYANSGKYNVTLTIEATSGCISEFTTEVEVLENPPLDFSLPVQLCVGAPLEVMAPVGLFNVEWNFGDPASGSNNDATNELAYHSYDLAGEYNITLSGSNQYGCVSSISKKIKIVDPSNQQSITVNGTLPMCKGEFVTLEGPSNATNWFWNTGAITKDIVVYDPGEYYVVVENGDGCRYETPAVQVDVKALPNVTAIVHQLNSDGRKINSSISKLEVCKGDFTALEAIGSAGVVYKWSNGRIQKEINLGSWMSEGSYQYSVEVRDPSTGCMNISNQVELVIHPVPQIPVITSNPSGPHCENDVVTFTVQNYNSMLDYVWSNGMKGQSITVSSAGEYNVVAYNQFGCSSISASETIRPAPDAGVVMSGCLVRCGPDTLCLPVMRNVDSYQWYKDGVMVPGPEGTIRDFIAKESGVYRLEVSNQYGCTDVSEELTLDITPGYGDLKITVYLDINKNGIIDAGDKKLENIKIKLTDPTMFIADKWSDNVGEINLYNVGAGIYSADVDNDSLELVPGINSVDIQGCDKPFQIDILLREKCEPELVRVDTVLCASDALILFDTTFTTSGLHQFERANGSGCLDSITVQLDFFPDEFKNLDTVICSSQDLNLLDTVLSSSGNHIINKINSHGCEESIEVNLNFFPSEFENIDTSICTDEILFVLDTVFTEEGSHIVDRLNSHGCSEKIEVTLNYREPQNHLRATVYLDKNNNGTLDPDDVGFPNIKVFVDQGGTVVREGIVGGGGIIDFDDMETASYLAYIDSTALGPEYEIIIGSRKVNFNGCDEVEEVYFLLRLIDTNVFIPNVFTPNGDNNNDIFRVYTGNDDDRITYFAIFDRWGELIFEDKNINDPKLIGWDGTLRGELLNPGVFVYKIDILTFAGEAGVLSGDVTLMR